MTTKTTILVGIAAAVAMMLFGCESDNGSPDTQYLEDGAPFLDQAFEANEAWSRAADAAADADLVTISSSDFRALLEDQLDAARAAQRANREALRGFGALTPPEGCEEVHANLVEALRLGERAFLEMEQYIELALRTGTSDDDLLDSANQALADTDRKKEEGIILMDRSDCF